MIPNAFYEVKYAYDRGIKRWVATFISREVDNLSFQVPLVDDSVSFAGDNVVCTSEEPLGLMFMQYAENVAQARHNMQQAEQATPQPEAEEHPLELPAAE